MEIIDTKSLEAVDTHTHNTFTKKFSNSKGKANNGITLIVLVITIIVLLILAGVSIAMLTGQNGILNQASKAKTETEKSNWKEKIDISKLAVKTEKEDPTMDDIIQELIKTKVIDNESQVNTETGEITTNKPTYIIPDKLNEYITNVKITISKTPKTEQTGGALLKLEKVEGISEIKLNEIDATKMSETDKKELIKKLDLYVCNKYRNGNFSDFDDLLKKDFDGNEENYWKEVGNLTDYISSCINRGIDTIPNYQIINPKGKVSDTCSVIQNGMYTFKVKDLNTGKIYSKSIEVTNIDTNMEYYQVVNLDNMKYIGLINKNEEPVKFEKAYIEYNNKKIDISSTISTKDNQSRIKCWNVTDYLKDLKEIDDIEKFCNQNVIVEIVKDEKTYIGEVTMVCPPE